MAQEYRPLSREEVARGRVAVASPGRLTTAALALSLWAPGAATEIHPFDQILEAVRTGRLEAGLLIHEGQLSFRRDGLTEVVDLGRWWKQETGLPLPLGGNVVRRDLGAETMKRISILLKESIRYALAHRDDALSYALRYARDMTRELADRFVGMYVNDWTLDYGPRGREAVQRLLSEGHRAGVIPNPVAVEFVG